MFLVTLTHTSMMSVVGSCMNSIESISIILVLTETPFLSLPVVFFVVLLYSQSRVSLYNKIIRLVCGTVDVLEEGFHFINIMNKQ